SCKCPGGVNAGRTGLEVLVHGDPPVDFQPGLFRQTEIRAHPDTEHEKIGVERRAIRQCRHLSINTPDGRSQMKHDAVLLVEPPNEPTHVRAHDTFQRLALWRDDVNSNATGTE